MKDTAQLQIFKDFDAYSPKYHFFKNSLFGQIHDSLPWEELAALLPEENTGPGAPKWFDARGMFALMFLKAYLNVSDRQLIRKVQHRLQPPDVLRQAPGRGQADQGHHHHDQGKEIH